MNTYRNIYSDDYALEPIRIEDLKPSSFCRAPLIQKKVAVHKKDICESLPSIRKRQNGIVLFVVVRTTTAADVMEILKVMKVQAILVRKETVRQPGMGLVIIIIFQIPKKKV